MASSRKTQADCERIAYEVACKMIDLGFIEDEPTGLMLEHEITGILKKYI